LTLILSGGINKKKKKKEEEEEEKKRKEKTQTSMVYVHLPAFAINIAKRRSGKKRKKDRYI